MIRIATLADKQAVEAEMPWQDRWTARSLYEQLAETAGRFPGRPAVTFQLRSGPHDKVVAYDWRTLKARVTQTANLFRRLGIGPDDNVAYILPNGMEAVLTLLGGATAGIVCPVNPLLAPETMGMILRETRARVLVSLGAFPKSDLAATVAEALAHAPNVETLLEVNLAPYLAPPLRWIVPLIRPKAVRGHKARVLDFATAVAAEPADALTFAETLDDRVCARFHTGGTTGLPKVAQHRASGILYNGWCGSSYIFTEVDVLMCPLPLFHVFAAYPILMSCLMSGASMVMPTPQGYRGEGVMDHFWKLIERHRVTFLITVPTAVAALMQRKVDADVSSLTLAISGSAAMPVELFHRFEEAAGIKVMEGYGMTEATCLVAVNPPFGERRIGSVGLPFPYTDVQILHCDGDGRILRTCATGEVGEICVKNPGVEPNVYSDPARNRGVLTEAGYLRTGDLGRLDPEGYLWITGRSKDLIIRGGHNIDPSVIEDALMQHPSVAFVGAIGQPDAHSGELPAAYVELTGGAGASVADLLAFAKSHIGEHGAVPKYVEVLPELPKTAVGKIFKPDLRRLAIARVFNAALEEAGCSPRVVAVVEDRQRGLTAHLAPKPDAAEAEKVAALLGSYTVPWQWATP